MYLSNIKIKNVKSFKDVSIDLNNFNVVIGPCASGKSNLIEIFKFLSDLTDDFEKAIHNRAGIYFKNINRLNDDPCYLKVSFKTEDNEKYTLPVFKNNHEIILKFREFEYELSFDLDPQSSFENLNEKVEFQYEYEFDENITKNTLTVINNGNIDVKLDNYNDIIDIEDLIPNSLLNIVQNNFRYENHLMINSPLAGIPINWSGFVKNISYYDFNPKLVKFGENGNGERNLSELGNNLAIILEKIFKDKEEKRKFLNLVRDLLPYVSDVNVEKIIDEKRIFTIIEDYSEFTIPSLFVSDGTSNILSLIVSLYFQKDNLTLIEEPERNIHPELFAGLVQMMEEVCEKKQIIITTHNPELLKHVKLENIYFISRNNDGFSVISKPDENEFIKPFIDEMGIDEVFVDNYLGLKDE